jgi:hypothetical protein
MKVVILIAVVALTACSYTKYYKISDGDFVSAKSNNPAITLSELKSGLKLYSINCSGCHVLHKPIEFTAEKWNTILIEMFIKSKLTDKKKQKLIENYLLAKCKR